MIDWNKRIVRIWSDRPHKSREYLGSAFFVSSTYLLTSVHEIYKNDWKTLLLKDGYPLAGGQRRLSCAPEFHPNRVDVALLTIDVTGEEIEKLSINDCDKAQKGDAIRLLGFNSETADLHKSKRSIDSYEGSDNIFITDHYVATGMSGGPVIRGNQLVGLTQARHKDKNQTHIISFSVFKDFLQQHVCYKNETQNLNPFGQEDLRWISALIDKTEQTNKVVEEYLQQQPKQSAFIVKGENKDWPEAVADRLAFELCSENLSKARKLTWITKLRRLNKDGGELLCCLVHDMLTDNKKYEDVSLSTIRNELKSAAESIVFSIKINPNQCSIQPNQIIDFINYWESQIVQGLSKNHVFLIVISTETTKKSRWFKFFDKNKKTNQDILLEALTQPELAVRVLPAIEIPTKGNLTQWKDECLPPHLRDRYERKENSLFKEDKGMPHYELQKKVVQILS